MAYVKWGLGILVLLLVAAFLHYTLPKRDIVYITGVEIKLEQIGANSIFWADSEPGAASPSGTVQRDVRFIDTVKADGGVKVYRNEDTGWGWPPYFKLDSSDLQAEARNLVSGSEEPRWVAMRHYGWRLPMFSIYPNAVSVRTVEGPDVTLIPWFNIVLLVVLFAVFWAVRVRWIRFRRRRLEPLWEDAGFDEGGKRSGWFRR